MEPAPNSPNPPGKKRRVDWIISPRSKTTAYKTDSVSRTAAHEADALAAFALAGFVPTFP